jgi:hypothetical protein
MGSEYVSRTIYQPRRTAVKAVQIYGDDFEDLPEFSDIGRLSVVVNGRATDAEVHAALAEEVAKIGGTHYLATTRHTEERTENVRDEDAETGLAIAAMLGTLGCSSKETALERVYCQEKVPKAGKVYREERFLVKELSVIVVAVHPSKWRQLQDRLLPARFQQ